MSAPSSVLAHVAEVVHLMRTAPDDTEAQRQSFTTLVGSLAGQELTIGVEIGGMTVNGLELPQGAPFADELRGQFSSHGISTLVLPAGLPIASLMILLQILARPRGQIRSAREFVALLEANGARGISVKGARDLPKADQLLNLDGPSTPAETPSFNVPSAENSILDDATPFWQEGGDQRDHLREAQVAVDSAAKEERWEEVMNIMARVADGEKATEDPTQKRRYRRVLQAMAPRATISALCDLSLQGHRSVVSRILRAIGAEATAVLLELMAEAPTIKARREFFTLLTNMDSGTDAIVNRLTDEKWFVVRNVAELCGELGLADAVPRLSNHIDHPDSRVRRAVAGALARIGTAQAAEPLRHALHDSEPTVRLHAVQSLDGAKSRGLAMTLALQLDEERHPDVRRELHLALGRIGTVEAIQALMRSAKPGRALFGRKPTAIRVAAVEGLALCNRAEAFGALKELADDKDSTVRQVARAALAQLETQ